MLENTIELWWETRFCNQYLLTIFFFLGGFWWDRQVTVGGPVPILDRGHWGYMLYYNPLVSDFFSWGGVEVTTDSLVETPKSESQSWLGKDQDSMIFYKNKWESWVPVWKGLPNTQFIRFTSTKLEILTHVELSASRQSDSLRRLRLTGVMPRSLSPVHGR